MSIEILGSKEVSSPAPEDSPGVIVFPPILFLGAIVTGVLLQILWPVTLFKALPARIIGGVLVILGGTTVVTAVRRFRRAGTNVRPNQPTTVIVREGPYRFTRNPMYTGNMVAYVGLSLLCNVFWPLVSLVPFFLVLYWGVVRREERYLEAKFGDAYRAYKSRVRRWI